MNTLHLQLTIGCSLYYLITNAYRRQNRYASVVDYAGEVWNVSDAFVLAILSDEKEAAHRDPGVRAAQCSANFAKAILSGDAGERNADYKALESSFTVARPKNEKKYFSAQKLLSAINYPVSSDDTTRSYETGMESRLLEICRRFEISEAYVRLVHKALENEASFVTWDGETSLYEKTMLLVATAECLFQSAAEASAAGGDPSAIPAVPTHPILVCSLDFLGIKDFKFQKLFGSKPDYMAAASLYIELLRECAADDLLDALSLTRANLIFSGGRHLHLYLPNTEAAVNAITVIAAQTNRFFIERFATQLYLSYGFVALPLEELTAHKENNARWYESVFSSVAGMKACVEARKYAPGEIADLNARFASDIALKEQEALLRDIAYIARNAEDDAYYCIRCGAENGHRIGYDRYLEIRRSMENADPSAFTRIYLKKTAAAAIEEGNTVCVWLCPIVGIESLRAVARLSCDQKQYGVLRVDIDDFKTEMLLLNKEKASSQPFRPRRQWMMSKHFSLFFRYYVNLLNQFDGCPFKNVFMIHEGADDAFFIGPWDEAVAYAAFIARAYCMFTNGAVTLSAGLGVFMSDADFAGVATFTQRLMDISKEQPGKNSITFMDSAHTYQWRELNEQTLSDICAFLSSASLSAAAKP